MWIVDLTINGTVHYISTEVVEDSRLTHIYWNAIISMDSVRIAQDKPWGGLARAEFGTITFRPDLFLAADWPPPVSCPISISYLGDAGTVWPTLFATCTAHLVEASRTGIVYRLIPADPFEQTETDKLYKGTLVEVFTAAVANIPGAILVSGGARSPSPPVNYLASGTKPIIDNLSDIAAFHAHRVVVDAGINTIYLFDTTANFTAGAIDETTYAEMAIDGPQAWGRYTAEYILRNANAYRLRPLTQNVPGWWSVAIASITVQHDTEDGMYAATAATSSFPDGAPGYEAVNVTDSNPATYWEVSFNPVDLDVWIEFGSGYVSITNYALQISAVWQGMPTSWELLVFDPNVSEYRSFGTVTIRDSWTHVGDIKSFSVPEHRFTVDLPSALIPYGDEARISPVCAEKYGDILAALTYIKSTVERIRVRVVLPVADTLPRVGQYFTVGADSGLPAETPVWMRVDEILYNIDESTCQLSGYGGYL